MSCKKLRDAIYFRMLFLFVVLASSHLPSHAQKSLKAGLNFTAELSNGQTRPGIGGVIEYAMTKHSGIETGLYYRTFGENFYFNVSGTSFSVNIAERHLSIPVLYKFSSRIVNFSAGPTFDFYLGWRQTSGKIYTQIEEYSVTPPFQVGVMLKLSKNIKLSNRLFLEPEVRLNPMVSAEGRGYGGLGISAKYLLK